jgi:quercetin dioxygenase-like cupin family protein
MRNKILAGVCCLGVALAAGGVSGSEPTGNQFVRLTAEQLSWRPVGDGVMVATLYGDPTKAGSLYVIRARFPPYTFDHPHYHPEDRHVTVLEGTWYTGTGDTVDLDKAVPLKAGSYMFHPAKALHWDGAKDDEVIVQITGIGPAPTILNKPEEGIFFSIKK